MIIFLSLLSSTQWLVLSIFSSPLSSGDALRPSSQNTLRKLLKKLLRQLFLSLRRKVTILSSTASNLASTKNYFQSSPTIRQYHNDGGRFSRGSPSAFWWTPECNEVIRSRCLFFKSCKQVPSLENYEAHREFVRQTYKILRRAKRKDWKDFCENFNLTPIIKV